MSIAIKRNFTIPSTSSIGASEISLSSSTASTSVNTGAIVSLGGAGISGAISLGGPLKLYNGSYYTGFDSAATANTTYIWPATSPSTGTSVLSSDAAGNLSWILMSASGSGLTLNGLDASTQYFSTSISGVGFTISSIGSTHTFNIGLAGNASTGLISSALQTLFGLKTFGSGVAITSGTASTSTTTGDLTVTGGVGIGGSLNVQTLTVGSGVTGLIIQKMVGGNYAAMYSTGITPSGTNYTFITDGQSPNFNGTNGVYFNISNSNKVQITSTNINITPTTASTSSSTGSLTVAGGVGIGGSLWTATTNFSSISGVGHSNSVITSGVWSGTAISAVNGGTGLTSFTTGDILYASSSTSLGKISAGIAGSILTSAGTGLTPYWAAPAATGVTSLAASTGISVNASTGAVTVTNTGVIALTGTANQVLVNGSSGVATSGNITLTTSQSIGTASSPSFADVTLSTGSNSTLAAVGSAPTSIVNKQYVDNLASGLDIHGSVRLIQTSSIGASYIQTQSAGTAATGSYLISTTQVALPAIDGITISATGTTQRVLINGGFTGNATIGGTTPFTPGNSNIANGIYYVGALGGAGTSNWILVRATDTDDNQELTGGTFTFVEEGTSYADSGWVCSNDTTNLGAIQFGNTAITFTQFTGGGALSIGQGLNKVGNNISAKINISSVGTASGSGYTHFNFGGTSGGGTADTGYYPTFGVRTSGAIAGSAILTLNSDGFSLFGSTNLNRTVTVTGSDITLSGGGNTLTLTGSISLPAPTANGIAYGSSSSAVSFLTASGSGASVLTQTSGSAPSYLSQSQLNVGNASIANSAAYVNIDASTGTRYLLGTVLNTASGSTQVSVGSGITIGNNLLTSGGIAVTNSTASSSTASGALIVSGGVGIGASLNIGGKVGINTGVYTGTFNITSPSASTPGLVVQGSTSQTADYLQILSSAGATNLKIDKDGKIIFPQQSSIQLFAETYSSTGRIRTSGPMIVYGAISSFSDGVNESYLSSGTLYIQGLQWTPYGSPNRWSTNNAVRIQPTSTSVVPLVVQLQNASWTSGNAFEIQNNSVLKFNVDYAGNTSIASTTGSGSTTTGALIVSGGVGIGGSLNIYQTTTANDNVLINAAKEIRFYNSSNTFYTGIKAGVTTSSTTFTLPITDGSANQVLYTNGSAALGWTSISASSTGITSLNGLVATTQTFATSISGTGFTIGSSTSTHTFYIGLAGNASTGLISSAAQALFGLKSFGSGLAVTSGTASTNTTTGALTVAGGVGITGQLSVNTIALGNTGVSVTPSMTYVGSAGTVISMSVLSDTTLAWEGSSGQLFSIDNNLSSGEIFSVSDISGLPVITASAGQTITLNEFGGYTQVGNGLASTSTTTGALRVIGGVGVTGAVNIGGNTSVTSSTASTSTSTGALIVTGGVGIGASVNIAGNAIISSSTASTTTTTGALIVSGGSGIGGTLNVGGNIRVGSNTFTKSGFATGDVLLDNGSTDTPGLLFYWGNNKNIGIDTFYPGTGTTRFRIVRELNESGGFELWSVDRNGYVTQTAWAPGEVIKTTVLVGSDLTGSNPTTINSASDTDVASYSYTPVSSNSYILIEFQTRYTIAGAAEDNFISRIAVDGAEQSYGQQYWINGAGGGTRSGVLFPLMARYTNSNTTAKTISVTVRRGVSDDNATVQKDSTTVMKITEIGR